MTENAIGLIIILIAAISVLAVGIARVFKKQNNSWNYLLAGLLGCIWLVLTIARNECYNNPNPRILSFLNYFKHLITGAVIVLGIQGVIQEVKLRKNKTPNHPSERTR